MRKLILLILVGALYLPGLATKPIQAPNELIWFGIDYTLVKFIGTGDQFTDLPKIQNDYFRTWNELIMNEKDKYDLNTAFSVGNITYQMDKAINSSQGRDMNGIVQIQPYTINEERVNNVVSEYTDPNVNQVGAMFVMETLNKLEGVSTMWLAVFNVASGEILYTRRYSGAVGGFGFRNFYARSLYNVISNLKMTPRNPE